MSLLFVNLICLTTKYEQRWHEQINENPVWTENNWSIDEFLYQNKLYVWCKETSW